MALTPDIIEQLARARADLRMGVPVVVTGDGAALILAAETLTPQRLADVLALGGAPVLAITARRAETLKARPYDGDLARLTLPVDASLFWVQAIADPADDLRSPMKGPLISARDGDALAHRAALALCKSARLLPAAVVLPLEDAGTFAAQHALTTLPLSRLADHIGRRCSGIAEMRLRPAIARCTGADGRAGCRGIVVPEPRGARHWPCQQDARLFPARSRL